ncbi:hypothetical protein ACJX0J_026966, partial [Zea mays]
PAYSQPMLYGRGPTPAGTRMVPMVRPDGRIGYVPLSNESPPTESSVPHHPASCQVDTRYSRHLSTPIAGRPFWYWSNRG